MGLVFAFSGTGSLSAAARIQASQANALIKPNASGIQGFQLVSASQGWLLINNRLYWSPDEGGSWKDITPVYSAQATIADVNFLDTTHGRVILTYTSGEDPVYVIARTTNSGSTWQTEVIPLFSSGDVAAIAQDVYSQWLDSQTGWLVIKQATSQNFSMGTLFRTTDGGHSWTRLTLPIGEPVAFVTNSIGWVAGGAAGDELYQTMDGGVSWQSRAFVDSHGDASQQQVYLPPRFTDVNNGLLPVMIANGRKVRMDFYLTSDGGLSWGLDNSTALDGNVDVSSPPAMTLFDADHYVMLVPRSSQVAVKTGPHQYSSLVNTDGKSAAVVNVTMADMDTGWALRIVGGCSETTPNTGGNNEGEPKSDVDCSLTIQLLRTIDGGASWSTLPLPSSPNGFQPSVGNNRLVGGSLNFLSYEVRGANNPELFEGHGFDECNISSLSEMQAWWTNGPYAAVNLYIGGSSRSCDNNLLTASFIAQLNQQGWKFIPTWVGPQAPCTSFRSRMSYDAATAYSQGVSEANSAIRVAANLSLTDPNLSNTIIYYDLEAYNKSDTACRAAAKAFMSGWAAQLLATGNKSGVYGTPCSSALTDFKTNPTVPDAVWIARWSYSTYTSTATVWGGSCISDSDWPNHQRIRQYAGGHNETWGSVTMNIDSNVIDGILAAPYTGSITSAPAAPANPKPTDGTMIPRTTDNWLYWATNGTSCSVHVWGGSIDIDPTSADCSSLHLGQQRGGAYSWQVTASNNYGFTTGPVWHITIRPLGPTDLTADPASASQIDLAWTPSSDEPGDIDDYGIYINGQYIASLPKGTVSTTISGLACNTSYSFFLRANRQNVQSANTNTASATTDPCTPAPFAKIGPVNTSPAEPTSLTLSWEASANADAYSYCYDAVNNDTCDSSWTSSDGTSADLTGLTPGTTYYWQVQAENAAGTLFADAGTWWSFTPSETPATVTTGPTLTPVYTQTPTATPSSTPTATATPTPTPTATVIGGFGKLSPANGASGVPASLSLQWSSVSGASLYIYCFDSLNNNACDTAWTVSYATNATISANPNLVYYWQVQALKSPGSVFADSGTWWSFTASNNPVTPVPTNTPASSATPTLTSTPTGTQATASPGPSPTPTATPTRSPTGTSTRTASPTPSPTAPATHTPTQTPTITATSVAGAPAAFGKINPAKGSNGVSVNPVLSWGSSSGAVIYIYCYDTVNNNNCDTSWTVTRTTSAAVSGLSPSLTYYWQIQAINATAGTFADGGAWWNFSPSGNPSTVVPSLTYTPTRPSTSSPTPISPSTPTPTSTPALVTLTPTKTPTSTATASPAATYTSTLTRTPSPTPTATVNGVTSTPTATPNAGSPGAFTKASPSNGLLIGQTSLTLSWTNSSGAMLYVYCYDLVDNSTCDTSWTVTYSTTVSVAGLSPGAAYYWQAKAINNTGTTIADGGTWWSFTVAR